MTSTLDFLKSKKKEMSETKYRKKFDNLVKEIDDNLLNTIAVKQTIDDTKKTMIVMPIQRADGSNDFITLPRVVKEKGSDSNVPRTNVPIAFSKILVAASALAGNVPDGITYSTNKIKARLYYDLWKRTFTHPEMNGQPTIEATSQYALTYGWSAYRVYPKQTVVDVTREINGKKIKTKKILYDDIYREPLDPKRTWIGTSYKPSTNNNRPEVLYELDIPNDEYAKLKKKYNKRTRAKKDGETTDTSSVTKEALVENPQKSTTHTTLTFYEHPLNNRYIVASDDTVFYDGEMPNTDLYGSVVIAHCWLKDMNDPHGVGLFEFIRGNQSVYNYINSLNAEQVEAEIFPILFASGNINGEMSYERSPNKVNVLPAGVEVTKILTTGNSTLGINYANNQKQEIDEITGVNNIVSGSSSETTLGATVILKEAALNRLIKPRNNLKRAIENDAIIYFSWLEQDQVNEREFVFSNEEEVQAFVQANEEFQTTENDNNEFSENGEPISISVLATPRVSLSFDFNKEDLTESDFQNQQMSEVGENSINVPRASALQKAKELDNPDQIGFDKVYLKVDSNSMLVPSLEIQKQTAMQLYPMVQNALQIIFGLARQDAEQAQSQLKSFHTFMEQQKQNIFDYIPKELYDNIMSKAMVPPPMVDPATGMPMPPQGGDARQADGTSVSQPQSPNEMPVSQAPQQGLEQGVNASLVRASQ